METGENSEVLIACSALLVLGAGSYSILANYRQTRGISRSKKRRAAGMADDLEGMVQGHNASRGYSASPRDADGGNLWVRMRALARGSSAYTVAAWGAMG